MASYKEIQTISYEENGIHRLTFTFGPDETCFPSHWHERLEILYIISGEIHLYMDEHYYVATSGQTVIITPLLTHKGIAGNCGSKYEVITFDISKFTNSSVASRKYLAPLAEQKIMFCPLTNQPEITVAITTLLAWLDDGASRNLLCSMGKMYELIGLFYEHCMAESPPLTKPDADFSEVLEYINDHFKENIMAKDISKKFGYDNAYFCRKFKAVTGTTMMRYVRRLRLGQAKNLLTNTDDSIKDIAWKCGFADISHLSNSFKKKYGLSPIEYRNRLKH
jgi:AraC-like DNA-binding protein